MAARILKRELKMTPVEAFKLKGMLQDYPFLYKRHLSNRSIHSEDLIELQNDLLTIEDVCANLLSKLDGGTWGDS